MIERARVCPAPAARRRPATGRARRPPGWPRAARSAARPCARIPPVPGTSSSRRPRYADSGCRRMRVAPGFTVSIAALAVEHDDAGAQVVEDGLQAACARLRAAPRRAAPARAPRTSCSVMSANERVRPPSSSREANTGLASGRRSATWRTPSASSSSGRASWLPRIAASSTRRTPPAPAPASACRCTCGAGRPARSHAAGTRGRRAAPPAHWPTSAARTGCTTTGSAPRAPQRDLVARDRRQRAHARPRRRARRRRLVVEAFELAAPRAAVRAWRSSVRRRPLGAISPALRAGAEPASARRGRAA